MADEIKELNSQENPSSVSNPQQSSEDQRFQQDLGPFMYDYPNRVIRKKPEIIPYGFKFGTDPNYFSLDGNGWYVGIGSALSYDELPPVPIIGAKLGSTAPTLATFIGNVEQYTFDATNDYIIGATETTHRYKEGTDIQPHIHWATNGVDGTDRGVKWQLEYSVSNSDETTPFSSAFPATTTVSIDTTIPANTADRSHILSVFTVISGTNLKVGAYIVWRLSRIASAATAPTSDPFGLAVGFHMQQDTLGTKNYFTK